MQLLGSERPVSIRVSRVRTFGTSHAAEKETCGRPRASVPRVKTQLPRAGRSALNVLTKSPYRRWVRTAIC